ncbi:MAG: DNA/RNA non-specific endonuclease [Akkermansia sp.]|nr:DNA/RNA non-specific endonuclease [Akkermansia sp.]
MNRKILLCLLSCLSLIASAQPFSLIHENGRTSVYDCSLEIPIQVDWKLLASNIGKVARLKGWKFKADVPCRQAKARHSDYTNSGYQRGHLCPAQDRSSSVKSMRSTFVMSNVAPQAASFNDGAWKQTEVQCRQYAVMYDSVIVVVQPVFLCRDTARIGRHGVAVPHAFFKAVFTAKNDSVLQSWFLFNK